MYHGCDITITPTCFLGPAGKLTDLIPWLDAVGLMMETFPGLKESSEDGEEAILLWILQQAALDLRSCFHDAFDKTVSCDVLFSFNLEPN